MTTKQLTTDILKLTLSIIQIMLYSFIALILCRFIPVYNYIFVDVFCIALSLCIVWLKLNKYRLLIIKLLKL
jgi:hypothetical protein